MNERYPCLYSGTALICTMSFLQSIVFALCTERDWSQWKLSWDLRLLTAANSVLHPSFFIHYTTGFYTIYILQNLCEHI